MEGDVLEPTLFDLTPDLVERHEEPVKRYDIEAAGKLAFVYTATEAGNSSGIRFMMTVEDAQAFCEDPRTCGVMHGVRWAFFWTRVSTFIEYKAEYDGYRPRLDVRKLEDNGSRDELIAELGLVKIPLRDFPERLFPLGVDVLV